MGYSQNLSQEEIAARKQSFEDALTSESTISQIDSVLPEFLKGQAKRFVQKARMTIGQMDGKDKAKLFSCDPGSLVRSMAIAAEYGLALDNRLCYMIPYGRTVEANFDWKALVIVAVRQKRISDLRVQDVREGDEWDMWEEDFEQHYKFRKGSSDRGKIVGAYAVAKFPNGSGRIEHMAMDELQKVRSSSKSPNSPAWAKWEHRMYCKAVARRLLGTVQDDPIIGDMLAHDVKEFQDEPVAPPEPLPGEPPKSISDLVEQNREKKESDSKPKVDSPTMKYLKKIGECAEDGFDSLAATIAMDEELSPEQVGSLTSKLEEKFGV